MPRRHVIVVAAVAALYFAFLAGAWLVSRDQSSRILVHPAQRYAGEPVVVDYDAAEGFVPGRPVLPSRP